jgi:hypothetical protein
MAIHEYLAKAIQDDARRAGARDRLLLEARRARRARRQRVEAPAAGAFLLARRSSEWLAARWPSRSGELADRLNGLPKVLRVRDPGRRGCQTGGTR